MILRSQFWKKETNFKLEMTHEVGKGTTFLHWMKGYPFMHSSLNKEVPIIPFTIYHPFNSIYIVFFQIASPRDQIGYARL